MTLELRVNAYGKRKAERFQRHFGLPPFTAFPDYGDVHDYLHTILGVPPGPVVPGSGEYRVLDLEEAIKSGKVPLPRGLL